MISMLKAAFNEPGAYNWQWRWKSWWHLLPHYISSEAVMDYGMPEYAYCYPTYQVNIFSFSCFQASWYSNYETLNDYADY